jgi:hypothetical protein
MKTLIAAVAFLTSMVTARQATEPETTGVMCSVEASACYADCYPRCQRICVSEGYAWGSAAWANCSKNCIPMCDRGCVAARDLCERRAADAGP